MQRGRSGPKGNGGGRFDVAGGKGGAEAARQLLLSILGGTASGSAQRGRAQLRGGPRAREGEWACCKCGFATNRPYREACHGCGADRGRADAGGGGGGSKGGGKASGATMQRRGIGGGQRDLRNDGGPVGANGARPMLGPYARAQRPGHSGGKEGQEKGGSVKTWVGTSGKGASCTYANAGHGALGGKPCGVAGAGKGECATTRGDAMGNGDAETGTKGGGGTRSAWVRPPRVFTDDGYEVVQPQKIRMQIGGQGKGPGKATATPCMGGHAERKRWSDTEDDDVDDDLDMDVQDAQEGDGGNWEAADDDADHDGGATAADPRELKARYEELARATRDLERRGGFAQDGVAIVAVRAARDQAEKDWREAKAPAPLPTRLGWAEGKLEKAGAALTRIRRELDDLDEEYDRRRADVCRRMEEADAWYRWRQEQRDELLAEAGEQVPCRGGAGKDTTGGEEVRQSIRCHLLPELQAVMEYADGNPEILEKLAMVTAGLVEAEHKLGGQDGSKGAVHYDMAQGDTREGQDEDIGQAARAGLQQDEARGAKGGERGGKEKAAGWRPEGPGRWARAAAAAADGKGLGPTEEQGQQRQQREQRESKGAVAKGKDEGNSTGSEVDAGEAQEARGVGSDGGAKEEEGGEKPPKQRKKQTEEETKEESRAEADRRNAEELHRQQQEAMAAQTDSYNAGKGGFGSQAALSSAARKFVLMVQATQARAEAKGVEPKASDGRALLELSPAELQEWEEEHLGGSADTCV